jgi:hypothetical protein
MCRLATWTAAEEPDTAVGTWRIGTDAESVRYRLGPQGEMAEVRLDRWGNPDGAAYGRYPFGASIEAEQVVQGVAIPSEFRAGWWWGTERHDAGEFFRAHVTDARFH